jgi:hypothetical protein
VCAGGKNIRKADRIDGLVAFYGDCCPYAGGKKIQKVVGINEGFSLYI